MARGTTEKVERNEGLKRDYLAGLTVMQLCVKYGDEYGPMTPKRVYDILHKVGITPNRRKRQPKK